VNKLLILSLLALGYQNALVPHSYGAVTMNWYDIGGDGLPAQIVTTLQINTMYWLGFKSDIPDMKNRLISNGYSEVDSWQSGGDKIFYCYGGSTLGISGYLYFGDGRVEKLYGNPYGIWSDIVGSQMVGTNDPQFKPTSYIAHVFSTVGTYSMTVDGTYSTVIWDSNSRRQEGFQVTTTANVVAPVPEPSSLSLLALGGVVVALRRRR
jgi:hypothetical protein